MSFPTHPSVSADALLPLITEIKQLEQRLADLNKTITLKNNLIEYQDHIKKTWQNKISQVFALQQQRRERIIAEGHRVRDSAYGIFGHPHVHGEPGQGGCTHCEVAEQVAGDLRAFSNFMVGENTASTQRLVSRLHEFVVQAAEGIAATKGQRELLVDRVKKCEVLLEAKRQELQAAGRS